MFSVNSDCHFIKIETSWQAKGLIVSTDIYIKGKVENEKCTNPNGGSAGLNKTMSTNVP